MEQVAHQAIVMQFILDLARALKVDPRGCFRQFFLKIKVCSSKCVLTGIFVCVVTENLAIEALSRPCQTADEPYQKAFDHELELLKERVRSCAKTRVESAMKDLEEEEKLKRLGPGGLDPLEVYQSLPKVNHFLTHASIHTILNIHVRRSDQKLLLRKLCL